MSTPRRDRLQSLFEVIDASSPEGSGALHFGGVPLGGVVLFDQGRLCWAARSGVGRRLTDLVCDVANVSRADVEDAYATCRRLNMPVGHVLVDRRLISPEQLRALLLRQTAETLVHLADCDEEPVWISHRGPGYRPQFTFTLPEVFASAAATGLDYDPTLAKRELATLVGDGGIGAAFDVDGHPLPMVVGGIDDYGLLRALGDWVSSVFSSWAPVGAPRFVTAETGRGGLVGWEAAGCVFAARLFTATGLVRVLAQLTRRL